MRRYLTRGGTVVRADHTASSNTFAAPHRTARKSGAVWLISGETSITCTYQRCVNNVDDFSSTTCFLGCLLYHQILRVSRSRSIAFRPS